MTMTSLPVVSTSSIHAYIDSVKMIPNLTAEEERDLAIDLKETGNLEAAKKLVMSHLKYVVFIAAKFRNYGFNQADLIQEGNIGLMKAIKGFDPSLGIRLVSYANQWISAEITDYIVRNFRIIKIATTKAQRKLFFNLRKLKKANSWDWMKDDEVKGMADHLNVSPEDVRQMESRLVSRYIPFCTHANSDDNDEFDRSPENTLGTTKWSGESYMASVDESEKNKRLLAAISGLDERSQDIIKSRWLSDDKKLTLHDLAAKYNVSAERIRQVEKIAMKKIKENLQDI